jgi:hypothetical protein
LLVEPEGNRNLELASRNLEGVKLVTPRALQAYDLLRHERLMLSKDTALHLGKVLGSAGARAAKAGAAEAAQPVAPPASGEAKTAKRRAPRKAAAKPKAKSTE